jgi:hypothetical protein
MDVKMYNIGMVENTMKKLFQSPKMIYTFYILS